MIHLLKSSFTSGEWAEDLAGRTDLEQYQNSAKVILNTVIHPYGGVSNRAGLKFVGELPTGTIKLVPFQYSVFHSYMLIFSHNELRIVRNGAFVLYPVGHAQENETVIITTQYNLEDLEILKFNQSADVIYLTHPTYPVNRLTRTSHYEWAFSEITWSAKIDPPVNFRRTLGTGTDNIYCVTAISENDEESLISNTVSSNNGAFFNWDSAIGDSFYNIYKDENSSGFFGWIGQSNNTAYKENAGGTIADFEKTPPNYKNPFNAVHKYPGVSSFFQQRLVIGRTNNEPQSIWGSVTGSFENMNKSNPAMADDSYHFIMNSNQVNEIRWLIPLDTLVIGTSGSEWVLKAGSKTDAITYNSVEMSEQSNYGSSHLKPVVIGSTIIFLEGSQKVVRTFEYRIEADKFKGMDLSLSANHLFKDNRITSWSYQQTPDSIIWCVRDDGKLLGLTFYDDHKVYAWHRHETDGKFLSTASVSSDFGKIDSYFVIEREINNVKKQYLEKFEERIKDNDIKKSFFVDSGLSYDGVPIKNISGLEHLKGKNVVALADGYVIKNLTVDNTGSVEFPFEASIIQVGLPFISKIKTMSFEFPIQDGNTTQDRKKYIKEVAVKLKQTRALKIGIVDNLMSDIPFRKDENYNESTKAFTGTKTIQVDSTIDDNEGNITIINEEPTPFTLLSLTVKLEYSDL